MEKFLSVKTLHIRITLQELKITTEEILKFIGETTLSHDNGR